jgi:uncharacterized protein (TIGR03435 family)
MRSILLTAFRVDSFQLMAPDWVDQTRIDIQAVMPAGGSRRDVPDMLQALLRDRFGLTTRIESVPLEVYELSVSKGGPKIAEVQPVDELSDQLAKDAVAKVPTTFLSETLEGPVRTSVLPLGQRTTTTRTRYDQIYTENRTTLIHAERMSMTELVSLLKSTMDEPVLDKTGLAGLYKFKIELPPSASVVRRMLAMGITTTARGTSLTEPTGVSVFKALEELGLKLEKRRSPVNVVVVDKLNRSPTPN